MDYLKADNYGVFEESSSCHRGFVAAKDVNCSQESRVENYNIHKIKKRIEMACNSFALEMFSSWCDDQATFKIDARQIDIQSMVDEIDDTIRSGLTTEEIDEMIVQAALRSSKQSPAYVWIASHVEISKMHKSLESEFSKSMNSLRDVTGVPLVNNEFIAVVNKHSKVLDAAILHLRDYDLCYDTIREIQSRFLARNGNAVLERIQHMFMRMAVSIHLDDIPNVLATYDLLSSRQVLHDPSMSVNAGLDSKSLSSTYAVAFSNIGIKEMYDAISKCVFAVRNGGKVAVSAQGVPCSGRSGTCRHEDQNIGLWAMLKLMDGAIAFARRTDDTHPDVANICAETWHTDIRVFLEYNNMHHHDLSDQKSLTITLSIPDIFMARVEDDDEWCLFCPRDVPNLINLRGNQFDDAYISYEASDVPRTQMKARDLWDMILNSVILTGGPSLIFKDTINEKSNVSQVPHPKGALQSDLRTGFVDTFAITRDLSPRNHASIALPLCVTSTSTFDFGQLARNTRTAVINLNKVLDHWLAQSSNLLDTNQQFRAIAVGMTGLADVFAALRMPYDSPAAAALNVRIAETMYYAALEASCDLAEELGPYKAFSRSPMARGIMQFDLWLIQPSTYLNWGPLRSRIRTVGLRNALLIAIGPGCSLDSFGYTASTDPPVSNVQNDTMICPWLVEELAALGLWTQDVREQILSEQGSIQDIEEIPADLKSVYRTAWEIEPETMIRMALQRAPFVCHTESLSLYLEAPSADVLGRLIMQAWAAGLKTGLHKLHTRYFDESKGSSTYEDADGSDASDREMSFDDIIVEANGT